MTRHRSTSTHAHKGGRPRASGSGAKHALIAVGSLMLMGACDSETRPADGGPLPAPPSGTPLPGDVFTSDIAAGDVRPSSAMPNPYVENAYVLAEGKRIYQWFNCAGCHGLNGGGGMGPPFADGRWIYGDDPSVVYQSVVQGRPNGMPAFPSIAPDQVWKIVAYVRSLDPDRASVGATPSARAGTKADLTPEKVTRAR